MEFENDTNYLDQHFLVNKSIINAFVDEAHLSVEESVVEIGPGKGQISDTLARRCGHLTCIEIDRNLEHFMNVLKDKYDNVDIIYGNALNVYIPECDKIISALPYSITEPFKELNKLALLTNSFFEATKIMDISREAFDPMPRVMSSMIRLVPIKRESLKTSFKRFIFREMFFHRDKKLKNNLMEALIEFAKLHDQKLTKKESKAVVDSYNIPKETLNKLMENLSNEEYMIIYNSLK